MVKFSRLALAASLAAAGAAACGDTLELVEPAPPPPPPLTASMAPSSAAVVIGNSVVFAVNASGAAPGSSASWTCVSSNDGIATVSVVETGCQASGLAAGSITVTARVTKGGETTNVGAHLTVTEEERGEPAFLLMSLPAESDPRALRGRVVATLQVERGDRTLERLSLLVDGEEVAFQTFGGPAMAAPEDGTAARQAVYRFTLSFDTDGYDALTGAPKYLNGEHTISAELRVAGRMMADGTAARETIPSNAMTVVFDNDDAYLVTADLGDNSAVGDEGRRWHGGPANGAIEIAALPVSFSGDPVSVVTMNFCFESITDPQAPYEFTFGCEGVQTRIDAPSISSAGRYGEILNIDDLPFPAHLDFAGPAHSPILVANPNGREDGWINAAVSLTAERRKDTDDAWLVAPAERGDEGGVGGYNMAVAFGTDLRAAVAAPVSSRVPAESSDATAYCAVATAADDLGNLSPLPDATVRCRAAPAAADTLINHDNDTGTEMVYGQIDVAQHDTIVAGQHLEFGVDNTPPTIGFGDDDEEEDNRHATLPLTLAFEPDDEGSEVGNSGVAADAGIVVGIQRRTASGTACLAIGEDGSVAADAAPERQCEATGISAEEVTLETGAAAGYYRINGTAHDKAGNRSSTLRRTFVYDGTPAVATAPAVPGAVEAGESFAATSILNDNLSIRDYYMTADFGDLLSLGAGGPVGVDRFNALDLTHLAQTARVTVDAYTGLQSSVGGRVEALDGVSVYVRDQAQESYGEGEATAVRVTDAPDGDDGYQTGAFTTGWVGRDASAVYAFCGIPVCEDEDAALAVKIEFRAIAPADGTFDNPFERVDFWMTDVNGASWFFGSDGTGMSGEKGPDGDDDQNADDDGLQTWSYSIIVPGTLLAAVARADTNEESPAEPVIRAIGVNENGVGVLTTTGVAIDTTAPDPEN